LRLTITGGIKRRPFISRTPAYYRWDNELTIAVHDVETHVTVRHIGRLEITAEGTTGF
jgi:hypothetical protein